MKKIILLGIALFFAGIVYSQDQPPAKEPSGIDRNNLAIRPNSRDYTIVRKGNNHQRLLQLRTQAMIRHRQAMLNRKMAMERRRMFIQQRMIRQQQIRQRMIQQRNMHR
jgi:hypothetical protein